MQKLNTGFATFVALDTMRETLSFSFPSIVHFQWVFAFYNRYITRVVSVSNDILINYEFYGQSEMRLLAHLSLFLQSINQTDVKRFEEKKMFSTAFFSHFTHYARQSPSSQFINTISCYSVVMNLSTTHHVPCQWLDFAVAIGPSALIQKNDLTAQTSHRRWCERSQTVWILNICSLWFSRFALHYHLC